MKTPLDGELQFHTFLSNIITCSRNRCEVFSAARVNDAEQTKAPVGLLDYSSSPSIFNSYAVKSSLSK